MADDRRFSPISFQGVNANYRSGSIANNNSSVETEGRGTGPVGAGFHDIDYVKELFRIMKNQIGVLVSELETELNKYSYIIDKDDIATQSAISSIVSKYGMTESPSYIHYRLYKHLLKNGDSTASNYIITLYESKLRNTSGSIGLDLLKLVLFISNEMTRMEEFIDEFIGEIDDTSEYRIIETFQSWGEDAYNTLSKILETSQKKNRTELPISELGQLNTSKAAGIQALFKVKLNALNQKLVSVYAEMYRDYAATADVFYKKYLGKALSFRLKISRDLGEGITTPILQQEISNTITGLDSNFSVHLADLYKRVSSFRESSIEIIGILTVRDSYNRYIEQLSSKGVKAKQEFSTSSLSKEESSTFEDVDLIKDFRSVNNYELLFNNSHSQLADLDDPEAHPQYLLKSGGIITGDIELAEDVKFGGIIPRLHKHNGIDGSARISGGDIEFNSITDSNLDLSPSPTGVPFNLALESAVPIVGPLGLATVNVQINFDIEDNNVAGYEFEIIELS